MKQLFNCNHGRKALLIVALLFSTFSSMSQATLHLYGGSSHEVYLGCLNCDAYNASSISNAYGEYGSKYNSKSIWNQYGSYGGAYSSYSPFNAYTSTPPAVVDKDGNFYGYLTINTSKSKRLESSLVLVICKYWKEIMEDVSAWYDKIFA